MVEKQQVVKSGNHPLAVLSFRGKLSGSIMTENHNTLYRENLAAYALGTLDIEEKRLLEEHLDTCAACQTEMTEFMVVSEGLLSALPPKAPKPRLKKRLMASLPKKGKTSSQSSLRPFARFSFGSFATTAALVILLGLNLFSALQIGGLQREQAELTQRMYTEQSAIAMLAYPGTQTISITEGVAGSLLMNLESNTAILFTWDLPELPEGQTYQIWLIDVQGNRVSGGLFTAYSEQSYTSIRVLASSPLTEFVSLGVTIEPWGGSPGPTGPNVLKVNF
jgi:anti-sigma-K factor RskA